MAITANTDILASDFIKQSERNATKSNDSGRVPKLETYGFLADDFLADEVGTATYNEWGDIATFVNSISGLTYTFTYTGDLLTSVTDGTNTWTLTWVDDKITTITRTP